MDETGWVSSARASIADGDTGKKEKHGEHGESGGLPARAAINIFFFFMLIGGVGLAVELPRLVAQALKPGADSVDHGGQSVARAATEQPTSADGRMVAGGQFSSTSLSSEITTRSSGMSDARDQQLKMQYLKCAHDSSRQRMDAGEFVGCSQVADVLLARSFNGDFDRMIDWWHAHQIAE